MQMSRLNFSPLNYSRIYRRNRRKVRSCINCVCQFHDGENVDCDTGHDAVDLSVINNVSRYSEGGGDMYRKFNKQLQDYTTFRPRNNPQAKRGPNYTARNIS